MSSDNEQLEAFLIAHRNIDYIRWQWADYSGVLRALFIPLRRCLKIAGDSGVIRLSRSSIPIPISTGKEIPPLSKSHETWLLRPDWSSIRCCGSKVGHATVMCFVDQKHAETRFDKCPRMLLVRALEQLEKEWGAQATVSFEIEFVLLDGSNNVMEPLDRLDGYSRTAGLRGDTLDLVEEIVDALERSSIKVHQFHAGARDQLQISLAPKPALEAVDSLVLAQETIRAICVRQSIKATMTPRPTLAGPSNGLYLHLSLNKPGCVSVDNFLAGVLDHMGSLCAFGMANYDGYVRSISDAAGAWIGFGTGNRDLPVRRISEWHWEFRMMDGTANPYLFVGAVLLAALDGLQQKTKLVWKDCKFFPDLMDETMRVEYGIDKSMPVTLKEALECLRMDSALKTWIAEDLLKWFISVKDKDVEEFGKMTDKQRRRRFLEYF